MSAAERQQRWRNKKSRTGMTRMDIWVPDDRVNGVRAMVSDFLEWPSMRVIGVMPSGAVPGSVDAVEEVHAHRPGLSLRDAVHVTLDNLDAGEVVAVAMFCQTLVSSRD